MSVSAEEEFKTILFDGDLYEYLGYEYISCPHLGLKKRENQTFSILNVILLVDVA